MEVRRPTHLTDDGEAVWTGFGIDGLVVTCPTDAEGFRDDDPIAQIRDLEESVAWFASALADSMRKEGESWIANLRLGTQLAAANERADAAELERDQLDATLTGWSDGRSDELYGYRQALNAIAEAVGYVPPVPLQGEDWVPDQPLWFAGLPAAAAKANERADIAEAALAARVADGPVVPLDEVEVVIARLAHACSEADRLGDRCATLEGKLFGLVELVLSECSRTGMYLDETIDRIDSGEFGPVPDDLANPDQVRP